MEPDSTGFCFVLEDTTDGKQANLNDQVSINYKGYLLDGSVFDSTYAVYSQYNTVLDTTRLIKGFVKGLALMKEGERAIIIVPFSLGYGAKYFGAVIPSYSTLVFSVKLNSIKPTI